MRPVHDIFIDAKNPYTAVAFIQIGNADEGYTYLVVCPWCEADLGYVPRDPDVDWKAHLDLMRVATGTHLLQCTAGGFHLRVYQTQVPLGTDKPMSIS